MFLVWKRIEESNKLCPGILEGKGEEEDHGRTDKKPSEMR